MSLPSSFHIRGSLLRTLGPSCSSISCITARALHRGVVTTQRRCTLRKTYSHSAVMTPLISGARFIHNTPTGNKQLDDVTIEVMSEESTPSGGGRHHTSSCEAAAVDHSTVVVNALDQFSKAKVTNFMSRIGSSSSSSSSSSTHETEVREIQGASGGAVGYHARLALSLPAEMGGLRYAEGYGPSRKDAETVASMHAERIVDALGLPLFQLSTRQRRHAEAARAAGRWAPLPGDPARSPQTASPPPLRYVPPGNIAQMERQLHIENTTFLNVTSGVFTPLQHTLASPYFLDLGSVRRLRDFFAAYDCIFDRYLHVTALHKDAKGTSKLEEPTRKPPQLFLAKLRLPIAARFGDRVCMGKAPNRKEAVALACMHAELTIDALGLALYPNSREKQAAHAVECRQVNRWCAEPGDCDYRYAVATPAPLQLLEASSQGDSVHNNSHTTMNQGAATAEIHDVREGHSVETVLVQHSRAVQNMAFVVDLPNLDPLAKPIFLQYLAAANKMGKESPFFVEALGSKNNETFRATASVPLAAVPIGTDAAASAHEPLIAIGIATSAETAEVAASTHALRMLTALNHPILAPSSSSSSSSSTGVSMLSSFCRASGLPIHDPKESVRSPADVRAQHAWMAPVRCVGDAHLGRILAPRLEASKRREETRARQDHSSNNTRSTPAQHLESEKNLIHDILRARQQLPARDYSLQEDADYRIIVSPDATAKEGRNYVHTLAAVRTPDVFATNRLSDYLERHGKRLNNAVVCQRHTVEDAEDREKQPPLELCVAKVVLPVPVRRADTDAKRSTADTRVVAHGEAFSEDDALLMCAMHAELLLDSLGVPLYDHSLLQRKHADAARMLGRWAPMPGSGSVPPVQFAAVPPPIRKEDAGSCTWARVQKSRAVEASTAAASHSTGTGDDATAEAAAAAAPTDDALCDISKLRTIHSREISRHALKMAQKYFLLRGDDFFRAVRQYAVPTPAYGMVHRAIAAVPLPERYGRRFAVGCSSSKKQAFALCAAHVTDILNALNLSSNTHEQGVKSGDTPSPPGLACLVGVHGDRPTDAPEAPARADIAKDERVWTRYVHACRTYMEKIKDHDLHESLFVLKQAPRSGVEVEDEVLDLVERAPLDRQAKSNLGAICARAGLPRHPHMRYEIYGRAPHKVFYTTVPVEGTPYVARGIGHTGPESVSRAAMHYACIITKVATASPSPSNSSISSSGRGVSAAASDERQGMVYNGLRGHFTAHGVELVLALFAASHAPYKPVHLTWRERARRLPPASSEQAAESSVIIVASAEYEDEAGLRVTGTGEHPSDRAEAAVLAMEKLFRALQRRPSFQAIAQLVRTQPDLRLGSLAMYPATVDTLVREMRDALGGESHAQFVLPPTALWESMRQLPLQSNLGFFSGSSQLVPLLLELAELQLGQSKVPAPLVIASSARSSLVSMGLAWGDVKTADPHNKQTHLELTPIGMCTAYLMQCVPPHQGGAHGKGPVRYGSTLPLQLGKLLLAGLVWQCLPQMAHMAAIVAHEMSAAAAAGDDASAADAPLSLDLVQAVGNKAAPSNTVISRYAEEVLSRVSLLKDEMQRTDGGAASSPFGALLAKGTSSSLSAPAPSPEILALCIAFAAYPNTWTTRVATQGVAGQGNKVNEGEEFCVESPKDNVRRARIASPHRSGTNTTSINNSNIITNSSISSSISDSNSSSTSNNGYNACFAAFDCHIQSGDGRTSVRLFGCPIPPVASLVASVAGGSDGSVLSVSDESPCVGIMNDGLLAIPMRDTASMKCLQDLQGCVHNYLNHLQPLPPGVTRCLEALMREKQTSACTQHGKRH